PICSCSAARSDQARHQSSQLAMDAVTSSKSVSATPLATKRGPQWALADLTRASCADGSTRCGVFNCFSGFLCSVARFVAPIPGKELPRPPRQQQLQHHADDGEHGDRHERLAVLEGACIVKNVEAKPRDRRIELRDHRTDECAARGELQARE